MYSPNGGYVEYICFLHPMYKRQRITLRPLKTLFVLAIISLFKKMSSMRLSVPAYCNNEYTD